MDTLFVLNGNKKVIDILSNNGSDPSAPFFDDTYTQELDTGAESYEFTTINNPRTNITLEVGNYILFKYNGKYKLFQIMETEDNHSEGKKFLTCYCEMAGLELLTDYCEPFSIEGNFITFMNRVLQDTNWTVGLYSAELADNIQTVEVKEYENVYQLIQSNLATYGGVELEFRVEFVNNILVGQFIDCYANGNRGNRTYKRFEYGEDVKGITRKRNIDELATAVIGVGKNGLEFKDVEWNKTLGHPCDKPLQQNFVADEEANDLWNNNGKYIKTVYKSDTEDQATLLQEAWDYLQEIKQPKFDYEVELALLNEEYNDMEIGDTNYVLDFAYNPPILLEARVGKLELSFADSRQNKCTLSNYKELVSMLTTSPDEQLVSDMVESHFPIQGSDIAMGAIGEGHINVTYYQAIKADIISAGLIEVNTLIADKVDTKDLVAINGEIENLKANKVDTVELEASNGRIDVLTSQVGNIRDLVAGNATTGDLQTIHLTSANTVIDNAIIKDAMIKDVTADKITTGTIKTDNVIIRSEDGGIEISGATQQFSDSKGNVRVQIGRDAQDNFTFCLFSEDGVGVLIDETGIKAGAVPGGLIVNDMISDEANITGGKIDVASLISKINGNTSYITSSVISFDDTGQSLTVAFNALKEKVATIESITVDSDLPTVIEQVTTNTTNIGVIQGKISSLIENTTITKQNGTVVQLKDDYNSTVSTVNSNATKIGSLETNYNKVSGDIASVTSKQSALEQNLDGFKTTVSNTYATKSTVDDLSNNLATNYSTTKQMNSAISQSADNITNTVSATYVSQSTFNNMRVGGENLLKRTDFSEVDIDRNTIPEWTEYGKIRVYNGYTPGEVPGQLMLVAKDSTEATRGIYQEISSSDIAKGTQVTLAFNLTLGSNASKKTSMYIDYYASGSLLSTTTITDEASGSSIGSVKRTFTTPDNGYDTIRVRLETGAPFSLRNHWITLRDLSLTRGNVAPAWAPNNVQVDYASKSELIQTAETLTSQISTKMESGEFSSRLQQSATDIQIGFNGINDYITIDPTNGIKVNHTDGSYTQISQNGFDRYVKGSRKKYKSLYTSGRYQLSGTGYYEDRTIVLPDEFNSAVESNFNFAAWISETHTGNTGNDSYIREFHANTGRMTWNGTNWQFTISAHILYYNAYQKKDVFSKGYVEWYVLV